MRQSSDLSPLYRASIGFDRLFEVLRAALEQTAEPAWPYYDILKYSDDRYRLRMAVPGFTDADLEVTQSDNVLTVKGRRSDDGEGEFLYRSLPQEDFERRFELAEYVKVTGAELANGLLTISLVRELPEAMRPRRLQIQTGGGTGPARITSEKQAA